VKARNPRVFDYPLSMAEAESHVASWLAQPCARVLDPGERHWAILQDLARHGQATGPLVMDAVLAAIAIEHGATLVTTDRDFARFPGLRWENPLSSR
jgi:toxin-antitoxin system PIN domain toxin